ncbi:uncharacterized protein LOC142341615 [Convolutriloba macropyga]|uniref:uncharacterized protein LOC142341615 n=1 Tax=Convolutriloba macropyga TaxID=536237 RepID=UPI003F526113
MAFILVKELQNMEFYLVGIQTVCDLIFTGLVGFAFFIFQCKESLANVCSGKTFNYDSRAHTVCPADSWIERFAYSDNFIEKIGPYSKQLQNAMENFPLYSQCFLMVGMSFERWVKVCRPHEVKTILSKRNQIILYAGVSLPTVMIPTLLLWDLLYFGPDMQYRLENVELQCPACIIESKPYLKHGMQISVTLISIAISGLFYFKIVQAFKTIRQTPRSKTLTKAFIFLWVSWVVCVLPSLIFETYMTHVKLSKSHYYTYYTWDTNEFLMEMSKIYGNWNSYMRTLAAINPIFRVLKHSYGFINSLLLIILLRPFKEPVQDLIRRLKFRNKENGTEKEKQAEKENAAEMS